MAFKREKVVRNAEKYVSKGKIEAAIKEYMKVLNEFPNEAGTLNRVGDLYARIDKDDDAIRLFTQIAEQYSGEGFLVKAIAIYKKILRLDPARLAVYERLGGLYYRQGLINEARGQYQVLADHYLKNSDAAAAINIYQRMSEIEPENPSHHLKLAELYQSMQLWEQAMESYDAIAGLMLEHDRVEEAFRVYQRALEVHSSDLEFIRLAVGRLQSAGGPGPAARLLTVATELNPAAQTIAESMRPDTGPHELPTSDELQAVEIDSQEIESSELEVVEISESSDSLESVEILAVDEEDDARDESGVIDLDLDLDLDAEGLEGVLGADALPDEPAASTPSTSSPTVEGPTAPPTDAIEGVAFEMDSADEIADSSDEMEFDLEFDLDLEIESGEIELPVALAGEPEVVLAVEEDAEEAATADSLETEVPAAVPDATHPEDLVAEAEVFAKYGLITKAEERVASVLEVHPTLLGARRLQLLLQLEHGAPEGVPDLARSFRELTIDQGELAAWEDLEPRLVAAGIRLSADEAEVVEPTPAVSEAPQKERVSKLLESLEEPVVPRRRGAKLDIDAALAELTLGVAPKKKKPKTKGVDSLLAEAGVGTAPKPPPRTDRDSEEVLPPAESVPVDVPVVEAPAPPRELTSPAASAEVGAEATDGFPVGADAGAPEEAPWTEGDLPSLDDDDLDLELEGFKLPEERPVESPTLDDSAMNWLDEIPAQPTVEAVETSLFDGEDEFFDLAAELEQELGEEDAAHLAHDVSQPEEPSLEDIVEGFKKGVAENLSAEDYGTHYNLGIAYREMGLLDEAIGEFQLASKDPAHLVECCSMLGICFTEKGLFDLAVKWYKRGLEAPDLAEDVMLSLLYDMGDAYQSLGDEAAARKTFNELSSFNIGFRDVIDRIEALGG